MEKDTDSQLDSRLRAYAATVRTPAIANVLKRSAEKWPVYAVVTGAAMAMANNASASIIYSGSLNVTVAGKSSTSGMGTDIIHLRNSTGASFGKSFVMFGGEFRAGLVAQDVNFLETSRELKKLAFGAAISGSGHTSNHKSVPIVPGGPLATQNSFGFLPGVHPVLPQESGFSEVGFAGFTFSVNGRHDHGWVRLQVTPHVSPSTVHFSLNLTGWAYDNTGAAILAGQEAAASPEPSTMALMLLAAGASGVEALRRRRKADASRH